MGRAALFGNGENGWLTMEWETELLFMCMPTCGLNNSSIVSE